MKISELQTRYGLASKQSVYDRMKRLKINPVTRGEISSEALDKLDKLDLFLKKNPGAKIWEFPRDTDLSSAQLDNPTRQLDKSTGQLDNFSETLQLVEAIARHFAANHILLLPTSKIRELVGTVPSGVWWFQKGTFIISKEDSIKIGRETAWRIQMTTSAFRPTIEIPEGNQ